MVALFQNAFAAPIVKDQSKRGQVLIDTGLYGHIRHPFYLGNLLFFTSIALWLESYASVIVLPLVFVLLVIRIFVEEKTPDEVNEEVRGALDALQSMWPMTAKPE
jgi:protein-S-isoprenylcysteine O-methyltransferase Ste14